MDRLSGRVAVVTGAASGIGRHTALALAARGAHLGLVDRDGTGVEATATEVRALGVRASVHVADVAAADRWVTLAAEVGEVHRGCHLLVNNAGVTSAGRFEDEDPSDIGWIVDINVWGVVHGCRAFLPLLRRADQAHIVNVSSMVGLLGLPRNATYALTKGAVRSFSEALRAELVTSNIGVTTVFPGAINTNIMAAARGAERERLAAMGRSRLAPVALTSPARVAARIVRAVERDRARVVVGVDAHLVDVLARILPGRAGLLGRALDRLAPPPC